MISSPSPSNFSSKSPPRSPQLSKSTHKSTFTLEDDICGSTLLDLVCRGHVLIANVLKLSSEIPSCFFSTPSSSSASRIRNGMNKNRDDDSSSSFSFKSLKNNLFQNFTSSHDHSTHQTKTNTSGTELEEQRVRVEGGNVIAGDSKDREKYKSILIDFTYFTNPERFDQSNNRQNTKSKTNREQLEQEFQATYQATLISFNNLFNDIYNLYIDLQVVCSDLVNGRFVRYDTLESVFIPGGGDIDCDRGDWGEVRRLICEALYVYGSLLILTDIHIPGDVRERLIIAHYRYCNDPGYIAKNSTGKVGVNGTGNKDGPFSISNFEELCKLFHRTHNVTDGQQNQNQNQNQQQQNTKSSSSTKKISSSLPPPFVKGDLLTRLPLPSPLILNAIESLITHDDPYFAQQSFYPFGSSTQSLPPLTFPQFEHRTTQLAHQASILFVTLLFYPKILKEDTMRMSLIVHKFFPDNWIIPLYDGTPIDLSIEWSMDRFIAAGSALSEGTGGSGVVNPSNLSRLYRTNAKLVKNCIERIKSISMPRRREDGFVGSGRPVDEDGECALFVLEQGNEVMDCLRCANKALRWQILHRIGVVGDLGTTEDVDGKGVTAQLLASNQAGKVTPSFHPNTIAASIGINTGPLGGSVASDDLMNLLFTTSQFEARTRDIYDRTIRRRNVIWMERKVGAKEKMMQLSDYYAGGKGNLENGRDEGLKKWFAEMAKEIDLLEYPYIGNSSTDGHAGRKSSTFSSVDRKIQYCVQALNEVENFDLIDRNEQVKLVLAETKKCLFHMVKIVMIPEGLGFTIEAISNFSYGRWIMEEYYVSTLHSWTIRDPKSLESLRPFFLKMTTFLTFPTARLKQRQQQQRLRQDLNPQLKHMEYDSAIQLKAVTDFYARSMLSFVTLILDVIPISIFSKLAQIVDIKEKSLMVLPSKIDVDNLKDYSRFEDRYKLAKITHELSILTAGILKMETTSIGNAEIQPHTLLERGLRKELVRQLSSAYHRNLQFRNQWNANNIKIKGDGQDAKHSLLYFKKECKLSLSNLARRVEGFKRAIEYIQDFLAIPGLEIFSEETSRIMGYNLEQEVQKYDTIRKGNLQSQYTSCNVPIPHYSRSDTDPYALNFLGRTVNALIKLTDFKSTIYSKHLNGWLLPNGVEVCGIEMISLMKRSIGIHGICALDVLLSHKISHELGRFFKYYNSTVQNYGAILEKIRDGLFPEWFIPKDGIDLYGVALRKTGKLMTPLRMCFCRVGQMQLLRKILRNELRLSAKLDANKLFYSVDLLNLTMMKNSMSDQSKGLMSNEHLDALDVLLSTGGGDPMATVFKSAVPLEGLPVLITLFIINHINAKSHYDAEMGTLIGEEEEPFDGWSMAAGISTVLRQFHPSYAKSVFALLSQYISCSILLSQTDTPNSESLKLSLDQKNVITFMAHLRLIGNFKTSVMFEHLPQHVIDMLAVTTEVF